MIRLASSTAAFQIVRSERGRRRGSDGAGGTWRIELVRLGDDLGQYPDIVLRWSEGEGPIIARSRVMDKSLDCVHAIVRRNYVHRNKEAGPPSFKTDWAVLERKNSKRHY